MGSRCLRSFVFSFRFLSLLFLKTPRSFVSRRVVAFVFTMKAAAFFFPLTFVLFEPFCLLLVCDFYRRRRNVGGVVSRERKKRGGRKEEWLTLPPGFSVGSKDFVAHTLSCLPPVIVIVSCITHVCSHTHTHHRTNAVKCTDSKATTVTFFMPCFNDGVRKFRVEGEEETLLITNTLSNCVYGLHLLVADSIGKSADPVPLRSPFSVDIVVIVHCTWAAPHFCW